MNREVCEHFNPVDLPCAKCVEKRKSEAAFLADELEAPLGTIIGAELHRRAAAELRRLHAENASLSAALSASCDEARDQMWESGGIAGCSRALSAEFQCAALLEVLKEVVPLLEEVLEITDDPEPGSIGHKARAAIAAVGGEKT